MSDLYHCTGACFQTSKLLNLNDAVDGTGTIQGLCVGEGWETRVPNCNWQCSWACRHVNLLLEGVFGFFLKSFLFTQLVLCAAGREGRLAPFRSATPAGAGACAS